MKRISLKLALTSVLLLSGPADSFDIEHVPLFLSNQVDPNLILTLDDSGSMRRAYVPELCGDSSDCAALDNRWAKSAQGNGLYYNPQVIYSAPVNAKRETLDTQFDAAWRNGYYRAGSGFEVKVDLSSNYRPTAALEMTGFQSCIGVEGGDGNYECYMGHFIGQNSEREVSGVMLGNKNNQEVPYFDITGFVDVDGSVKGIDPGSNLISVSITGVTGTMLGLPGLHLKQDIVGAKVRVAGDAVLGETSLFRAEIGGLTVGSLHALYPEGEPLDASPGANDLEKPGLVLAGVFVAGAYGLLRYRELYRTLRRSESSMRALLTTTVDGVITEVNEELRGDPSLANTDPLGKGWFFKLKLADKGELAGLMDEAAYEAFVKSLG